MLKQETKLWKISVRFKIVKISLQMILVSKTHKILRACIDSIITNRPKCFQGSMVIETGLLDFHEMPLTAMKVIYNKN